MSKLDELCERGDQWLKAHYPVQVLVSALILLPLYILAQTVIAIQNGVREQGSETCEYVKTIFKRY